MESHYHWLVTVGLVTSSVIAVTANAFLLLVFTKRRNLRTIPNRFIINLLLTNLLSSLLLIPLLLVDQDDFPLFHNSVSGFNKTSSSTSQNFSSNQPIEEDVFIKEEFFKDSEHFQIIKTSEEIISENLQQDNYFVNNLSTNKQDILCNFAQASTSFVCTASIFSILLIGINQYFGVIHSLRYHFYINKFRASVLISSSWLAALICCILSTATYSDSSLWHFCDRESNENRTMNILNTTYSLSYFMIVILAPFVAICIIYYLIYTAAHQNSERMRKSTSATSSGTLDTTATNADVSSVSAVSSCEPLAFKKSLSTPMPSRPLTKVHSAPNFSSLENCHNKHHHFVHEVKIARVKRTVSDRNNFITNLKHKISNASMFRYREETKAARISVIVILMVLICYVPYGLTLVLTSGCIRINPGEIFNYLSLVLLVFSNVISPFLFGYRNKRIKREIGKMLGIVPPMTSLSSSSNSNLQIIETCQNKHSINNAIIDGVVVQHDNIENVQPLLHDDHHHHHGKVPKVVVTCKVENERKSILKRVGSGWNNYKKCNFITVPDSCLGDARGSFSSASTQVSNDD